MIRHAFVQIVRDNEIALCGRHQLLGFFGGCIEEIVARLIFGLISDQCRMAECDTDLIWSNGADLLHLAQHIGGTILSTRQIAAR